MDRKEQVYTLLFRAHLKARRAKRLTKDEHNYELRLFENLMNTATAIVEKKYQPSRGIAFVTHRPVLREIFAAPYRDRVVHHLLFDKVIGYWEKHFIFDSYSCRKGKGTMMGIRRAEKFLRQVSKNSTQKAYVLKYDLSGYFMSLPREELYRKAVSGLREQYRGREGWEFKMLKFLWRQIIFDDPTNGVRLRGLIKDWRRLEAKKSLFKQEPGKGIVIGNLTSQLLSNIYLNDFDHFMKENLRYKFYGRYVDDFFVFVPEDEYNEALANESRIQDFLAKKGLKINTKKTYRQEVSHGVDFLGVVIFPFRTVVGARLKRHAKAAARKFRDGVANGDVIVSYWGFLMHHDCVGMIQRQNFVK